MKSLVDMFNERVGITTVQSTQDEVEYLTEREGIRIYDGEQDETAAIHGAEQDLVRLQGKDDTIEQPLLDL